MAADAKLWLHAAEACITVTGVMLSLAYTMPLIHGALSGVGFVSCRPVDEPAQRTNDAADAA